ncbi:MAG: carboxypeptidase YodJ [Clostridiales bacterium]|jgi:D-alanyl-D-alanine carboxypeptidase|nr:carboxypeptidase YodJ [Clostridiales bacterium]
MFLKAFVIIGICLTLTACTNDANSNSNTVTATTTDDRIPTVTTPTVDDPAVVPTDTASNEEDPAVVPTDTVGNEDNGEVPSDTVGNEDNGEVVGNEDGDVPAGNTDEQGKDSDIDYLTIRETPLPAISTVEDILLVNKSFYLEKDYAPSNPTKPNIKFSFSTDDETRYWLTYEAATAIEALFADAKSNNVELAGVSLYRSYNRQKGIYNANVERQGLETASKYSAKPGFSEHQTGLAIDVSAASVNFDLDDSFGSTMEGEWVTDNCARFGFIIRFLKGKEDITGYAYEPWHLRYVGIDAAKYIMENEITLEEYYALKDK